MVVCVVLHSLVVAWLHVTVILVLSIESECVTLLANLLGYRSGIPVRGTAHAESVPVAADCFMMVLVVSAGLLVLAEIGTLRAIPFRRRAATVKYLNVSISYRIIDQGKSIQLREREFFLLENEWWHLPVVFCLIKR